MIILYVYCHFICIYNDNEKPWLAHSKIFFSYENYFGFFNCLKYLGLYFGSSPHKPAGLPSALHWPNAGTNSN